MEPNWLNAREDRAWRAFMSRASTDRGPPEPSPAGIGPVRGRLRVLASLSALDGDRMPAHDLCNALGWEKSRLSHQLRRMEKDGLISREPNPDDARSTMVSPAARRPRRHREGGARARGGRPPELRRPVHPG